MPDSTPVPMTACWLFWLTLPTGDQAAILDAMDLTDPQPISFARAVELVDEDAHAHEPVERVFVTPELDGWTLVVGGWCDPTEDNGTAELCAELSLRFCEAHAYYYGAQNDGSAWLIAQQGKIIRRAVHLDSSGDKHPLTLGDPLPYEHQCRLAAEDPDDWEWIQWGMAPDLAGVLSINPLKLGPATPHSGQGVIARTPPRGTPLAIGLEF